MENFLILPNKIRFSNHKLYAAPKTILVAHSTATQVLVNAQPRIIKNSPTKLLVPGRPKLPNVNNVKKVANNGIVVNKPE